MAFRTGIPQRVIYYILITIKIKLKTYYSFFDLINIRRPIIVKIPPKIIVRLTASENKKYAIMEAITGSPNGKDATTVGCT